MATRRLRAGPASIYTSKVTNMSMAPLIAGEFPMKLGSWRASSYVVALFVIILCPCAEGFGADPASAPANGGFEQAKDRPDGWRTEGAVSVDAIEPFEGAASLKLYVDPLKLIPTRAVSEAFAVSGNAVEVAGATRSDLYSPDMSFNGNIAIEFLDAAGKAVDTRAVAAISGTTPWKRFRKTVPMAKNAAAARLVAQIEKSNGGFWLDALRATSIAGSLEPSCVVRFSTAQLGNMLYPQDPVVVDMKVESEKPLDEKGRRVACQLTDYWGVLQAPLMRVMLEGSGTAYTATIHLTKTPLVPGKYYELHTEQDLGGTAPFRESMSFAILPEAETKKYEATAIPFGTHTWDARLAEYFYLSARMGCRRCLVFWGWPETPPHAPVWKDWDYDVRLGIPKELGMRPYGVLYPVCDVERLEGEHSEEEMRAGVRQSIKLYKKDGLWGFQAGNEPPHWNHDMVKKDVETYRIVYEEAKKTDPDIFIIGSAIGPNEVFFKEGFGEYCDAYNLHSYSSLSELRGAMRVYKELFKKYGHEKPIYSTEIGSQSQGLSRHEIAMDLVRKAVCFFADGGSFFTWFAITYPDPDGKGRGGYSDSMNLFDGYREMYNPRLDAIAYYNIINGICDKTFVREIAYDGGTSAFLFRNGTGECLQVLWNQRQPVDVAVPLKGVGAVRLVHLDGTSQDLDARGDGLTLRIGMEPVLLLYTDATGDLPQALGKPRASLPNLPAQAVQGGRSMIEVRIEAGMAGEPRFLAPPDWTSAKASETLQADGGRLAVFSLDIPADTTAREATCTVLLEEQGKPAAAELCFRLPIAASIDAMIVPLPADAAAGEGRLQLTLSNSGAQPQAISWDVEILREIPMEDGEFVFDNPAAIKAHFLDLAEGSLTLAAGEEKRLVLKLAQVDRLTIYEVRARTHDAAGKMVSHTRLVGGFVGTPKAKSAITIDGDLTETDWQRATVLHLDGPRQFYKSEKPGHWNGPDDLTGTLRFLWDEKYLYLTVDVVDNVFCNPSQDGRLWSMDGLQFLIDPARDQRATHGRYDIAMGIGRKGPQAWCHMSADVRSPEGELPEVVIAAKRAGKKNGDITYEVAIPWTRLAPFTPAVGRDLGLAMILNEDDGETRSGFLAWFSGVHLKEMGHVGDLLLQE